MGANSQRGRGFSFRLSQGWPRHLAEGPMVRSRSRQFRSATPTGQHLDPRLADFFHPQRLRQYPLRLWSGWGFSRRSLLDFFGGFSLASDSDAGSGIEG